MSSSSHARTLALLVGWAPNPSCQLPAFPAEIWTLIYLRWLEQLVWPEADCANDFAQHEVTWLELALCFSIEAHRLLPIVCKSADSSELLEHVEDMADAREHKVVHTDQPNTAMLMWTQFMSWCDHASAPKYTRMCLLLW